MTLNYEKTDDTDPRFFRYARISNGFLFAQAVTLALFASAFTYCAYGVFLYKPASEIGIAMLLGGVGLTALIGLSAWNLRERADKEEMFTVWAIKHHGLTPLDYKLGSRGSQLFTAMETGDIVTRIVVKDRTEFKSGEKNPSIRVSLQKPTGSS
jgi:hypothetical protein